MELTAEQRQTLITLGVDPDEVLKQTNFMAKELMDPARKIFNNTIIQDKESRSFEATLSVLAGMVARSYRIVLDEAHQKSTSDDAKLFSTMYDLGYDFTDFMINKRMKANADLED